DGGYLLGGNSSSGSSITKTRNTFGLSDYWVVKIDSNGIKKWDSIYGGTSFESLRKIIPTSDGGYLLGGYSESNANGNKTRNSFGVDDYWIVKIDANGTKQWDSIYGGASDDMLTTIISTNDGGYLLGGISESNASGNKTRNTFGDQDYWLVKINANGTKQWDSIFGGTSIDQMFAITSTSDGGYLLGGPSFSPASGNKTRNAFGGSDYWVIKIDANGTKQWDSIYGGTTNDNMYVLNTTNDGGFLLGGGSLSGVGGNKTTGLFGIVDCWLVKIDANGIKQWDRTFGGTGADAIISLTPTNDNGYLLGAISGSDISGNKTINSFGFFDDYWVVKIDANGTKINEKVYGGTSTDEVTSMVATKDGGYLIGGYSQSGITGNKTTANFGSNDYWVVKVVPAQKITPVSVSRTVICSPDSLKVFFDKGNCGTFKTGNKFYVQLSNSVGSFASPTILDSLVSITTPNSIIAKTPSSLTEAATYKIRLVSTLPAVISDTVSNIQILTYPNISSLTESCSSGKQFSATVPASSSKQWQLNGSDIASATASSFFPILFGNYRLRTFNTGCKDTSDVYSVVPATIASTDTCTITDGLTRFICDNTTGNVMAKIVDAPGGNILGSTSAKLYIDASVQYYQSQPYLQRHYDITPTSSGAANVTLYVPQSEYNAYNTAVASNYPHLPSSPSDALNMNNLVITQYHGTSVSHLPGTYSGTTEYLQSPAVINTWNSSTNMWEINFNVTAFSGIFLHTLQNFALPVELLNFSGKYLENKSVIQLNWQTASELNCAYFEVERINENGSFEYVGTVNCNGTTNNLNSYSLDDFNYKIGNNYYRLKQVDEDGKTTYSNIILIMVDDVNSFYFQTISDKNTLTISSSDEGTASLCNANGSLIKTIQTNEKSIQTISTNQLAKGIYFIRFANEKNTKTNKIIIK
ncbi:MAG TPA: T9SS type A sorting domain-containing protein, partial [Chitinophagales bacterium]|nr:T9SS type A sorting domain-containing protein [Chitinophagales bacterium]